jgi:hypothetical protein
VAHHAGRARLQPRPIQADRDFRWEPHGVYPRQGPETGSTKFATELSGDEVNGIFRRLARGESVDLRKRSAIWS